MKTLWQAFILSIIAMGSFATLGLVLFHDKWIDDAFSPYFFIPSFIVSIIAIACRRRIKGR